MDPRRRQKQSGEYYVALSYAVCHLDKGLGVQGNEMPATNTNLVARCVGQNGQVGSAQKEQSTSEVVKVQPARINNHRSSLTRLKYTQRSKRESLGFLCLLVSNYDEGANGLKSRRSIPSLHEAACTVSSPYSNLRKEAQNQQLPGGKQSERSSYTKRFLPTYAR